MSTEPASENTAAPEASACPIKKCGPRRLIVLVIALIALIGAGAFFASQAGLDKALVEQALDRFAQSVKKNSENLPVQASFSYKEVRIEGGLLDRHAVIVAPEFSESALSAGEPRETIYRTEEALVFPASRDLSALRVELAKPLQVYADSAQDAKPILTVTQKQPLVIHVAPEKREGVAYTNIRVALSDTYLIDRVPTEDSGEWEQATLSIAPGGSLSRSIAQGGASWSEPGEQATDISDLKLVPEGKSEEAIHIAAVQTRFTNRLNAQKRNEVTLKAEIGPVTGGGDALPFAPLALKADVGFTGMLSPSPEAVAEAKSASSELTLNTLELTLKDASVVAKGSFASGAEDVLPEGNATIELKNYPALRELLRGGKKLDAKEEAMLDAVLEKIHGASLADAKDLSIAIERKRGGAFRIGATTFEELLAVVLKGALAPVKSAPAPMEPPVAAPAVPEPAPAPAPADADTAKGE